jgi:hypothetical protein
VTPPVLNPVVALAIEQAPNAIKLLMDAFASRHPNEPQPTSEEVEAAWQSAFTSSLAKDDAWLAAHPRTET